MTVSRRRISTSPERTTYILSGASPSLKTTSPGASLIERIPPSPTTQGLSLWDPCGLPPDGPAHCPAIMKIYPRQSSAAGHARRSVLPLNVTEMSWAGATVLSLVTSNLPLTPRPIRSGLFYRQPSGLRIIWIVVLKSLARVFTRAAAACVEAANQAEGQCARYDYSGLE